MYNSYSQYLKKQYGEKVYKLPVNLPVTCPNRQNGNRGCAFCAGCGTGFEAMEQTVPVTTQLLETKAHIERKYHAHKFIAYFQNYTNTFLPVEQFLRFLREAASVPDIVEIAVSTRPDCIREDYLEALLSVKKEYHVNISIELGLQTVNYHTLREIGRGHTLAEFLDAVLQIKKYGFEICAHVILNLPNDHLEDCIETAKCLSALRIDAVKIHSLYIAKNTRLCEDYETGTITICSKEEYYERLISFLEYLNPNIVVERLFSRVPEKDSVFCNWGTSWWKLKEEAETLMKERGAYQGRCFNYLNGAALKLL